ncbi:hypothetical protein [Maricaulis sp.]|uniref:hypothetical protein n=1 Tax=Maricaulis sp. TaxID=1486257 RepID=UPI003299E2E0
MTARTPIACLVAAADRVVLSDRPTPEQIAHLRDRTDDAVHCLYDEAERRALPGWAHYQAMALIHAAQAVVEAPQSARDREALSYIARAAHRVDDILAKEPA